ERDTVLDWYSPLNFFQRQQAIHATHQEGTGGWFLRNETFKEWKSGMGKILWCDGAPGVGKTVLCSIVVDHLRTKPQSRNIGVAVIYLDHKESRSISHLLAGLWRQLVVERPINKVQDLYEAHREPRTRPYMHEYREILISLISEYSKVFILADGLDECPDSDRDCLLHSLSQLGTNVNLMLISRPHVVNHHHISDFMTLRIEATAEDIRAYIQRKIQSSARISQHLREAQKEIEEKIIQRSSGMFLLAKIHVDSVTTQRTMRYVNKALDAMSDDLEHAYNEAVARINRQSEHDKNVAWRTLLWITNAKRPLRSSELLEALAVEPDDTELDRENLLEDTDVLSACLGLVEVNRKDGTMCLIHDTIQHYM
ncbi:hypothetical protein K438DRAFT_1447377, partial [Mycena galopus ATCC 62051]